MDERHTLGKKDTVRQRKRQIYSEIKKNVICCGQVSRRIARNRDNRQEINLLIGEIE